MRWFKENKAVLEFLDATTVQHNLNVFGFNQRQNLQVRTFESSLVQARAVQSHWMENGPFGVCTKLCGLRLQCRA